MAKILIIDDEPLFGNMLADKFMEMNHEADCAFTLQEGISKTDNDCYDVVYLDVHLPDGNGLDEINRIRGARSAPEVIIVTGGGDPEGAELAIKSGAWDYIVKPSSISSMTLPMVRALQYRELSLKAKTDTPFRCEGIVGISSKMRTCFNQIAVAARAEASVLIHGETGTGKELVAGAIHGNSSRADRNFVVVDCASLSETLIENVLFGHIRGAYTGADSAQDGLIRQADGGTLFLDEIGELPVSIQKSFLRVLQERRFRPLGAAQEIDSDFRLIAATNRNLDEMAEAGQFRSDLLYRVRSFQIDIPPLRDRLEDIETLAACHVGKICDRYSVQHKEISAELLEMFNAYSWPGNVRELVNALERAVAAAGDESTLILQHLPENLRIKMARARVSREAAPKPHPDYPADERENLPSWEKFRKEAIALAERQYLQNLLQASGNDLKGALALSGLSRSRLYEVLKKHQLTFPL